MEFASTAAALAAARTTPLPDWLATALAAEAADRTIEVEGAKISYRIWGAEAADLPGVLLVHGFRAHARWWDHIAPLLAGNRRVVALSFSGMGESGRRERYSREQYGREILAVLEAESLVRPAIVAHSFGGSPSMIACRIAPDRIGRVVLIDSGLRFRGDLLGERMRAMRQSFYRSAADALSHFRLVPPGRFPNPHVLAHIAETSLLETGDGWTWSFDPKVVSAITPEPIEGLETVAVPVDFLYGELSEIVPHDTALRIAGQLRNCSPPAMILGSHHHVLIEQPLALVEALRALLVFPAIR